jgi:hypothetical protein
MEISDISSKEFQITLMRMFTEVRRAMHWQSENFDKKRKWAGRVAQVAEHLPSNSEALSSNPRTTKKDRKSKQVSNTNHRVEECTNWTKGFTRGFDSRL